jgi:hypothetical protein
MCLSYQKLIMASSLVDLWTVDLGKCQCFFYFARASGRAKIRMHRAEIVPIFLLEDDPELMACRCPLSQ